MTSAIGITYLTTWDEAVPPDCAAISLAALAKDLVNIWLLAMRAGDF